MSVENAVEAVQLTRLFGDFTAVDQVVLKFRVARFSDCLDRTGRERPPPFGCCVEF